MRRHGISFELLKPLPVGALVVEPDGTIVLANRTLETLFGYAPDELTGGPLSRLIPKDARDNHADYRSAFFGYPSVRPMGSGRDLCGVAKDGRHVPVEVALAPFESETGPVVLATVVDLTERKAHEARFLKAIDAAASAILMVDETGRIQMANEVAREIFGYSAEAMTELTVEALVPQDVVKRHRVFRGSYFGAPENRAMGLGRNLRARRMDGSDFPVEIGLRPLEMEGRRYVLATVIDLSQRAAAEEQIRAKNRSLERLNDELRAFAYTTSHDLRAPLASIIGLTDVMKQDLADGDHTDLGKNVTRIAETADRLQKLVEDILKLARVEREDEGTVEVSFAEMLGEIFRWADNPDKRVQLQMKLEQPSIVTQPVRLRSVLANLISNAVKYARSDGESLVTVHTRRDGDDVVIEIRDNGMGIPSDSRPELFRPFRRFHGETMPGSGLGLAIVARQVGRLGGEVGHEQDDAETVFRVRLPLAADAAVGFANQAPSTIVESRTKENDHSEAQGRQ